MLKRTTEGVSNPLDVKKRPMVQIVQWSLVIAIGFLCLWQFHIPQFSSNFDIFPGDRGDARLVAYLMEHWYRVFQGLADWRSPAMFYPVEGVIGYADLMFGYGIVYSVLRTFGLGIFEAAEFTIILFNFLNYLVCFILLHKVLRYNLFASMAGAAFFAFNSPKLVQLGHLQLQPIAFLPLAMIGIVLLVQKRETLTRKQAFALIALSTLSLALQLLTGFYPGWFFIFWSALFLIVTLLFTQTRKLVFEVMKKFWLAMIGAAALFLVALIPFVLAYLPVFRAGVIRSYKETLVLIPVGWSFLLMGHRNYLWGGFASTLNPDYEMSPELQIGIGLIPSLAWLGLFAFALWLLIKFRISDFGFRIGISRNSQSAIRNPQFDTNLLILAQLIIATSLVYLLGLRYWNDFSPWQFVYAYVPGGQVVRAVARYALVVALPMAIAFAFLLDFVIRKISLQTHSARRILLFAVLLVITTFGMVEQFGRKEGFNGFSISHENEYLNRLAQALPNDCSTFYVGLQPPTIHNQFEYQLDAMFVSMLKGLPTLNGYTGHLPANWGLYEVADPRYEENVKQWIAHNQIKGSVCRLFIPEARPVINLEDPKVFIRQQYRDILRREPDDSGLQLWLDRLNDSAGKTGKNSGRVSVSLAILESDEFRDRGYFVIRLYLVTLGRPPRREEFVKDHDAIFSSTASELEAKKEALVADFVGRSSAPEQKDPRKVRALVDDPQTIDAFRNQAFVLMQFFAHLSRDPKPGEYEDRLNTVNANGDLRQLIFDFIYSGEYRKRFGYVN